MSTKYNGYIVIYDWHPNSIPTLKAYRNTRQDTPWSAKRTDMGESN